MSMDKRLSMLVIAEAVIEQIGKKDVVNTVKEQLMHKKGISEAAALPADLFPCKAERLYACGSCRDDQQENGEGQWVD